MKQSKIEVKINQKEQRKYGTFGFKKDLIQVIDF